MRFVHYKGGIYRFLRYAKCSETLKTLVVYQSEANGDVWARPLEMWNEKVMVDDIEMPRFQLINGYPDIPRPSSDLRNTD
ncbi:DUF1653 domain-containing protein [Anaerobacillus sp. MEB173]|uniref:DUF1653 domain-containing protein n=1 Tax=Anaerobacillus sp. MEB173 TaxID=3383345 RepID=UPI003F9361E4